MKKRPNGQARPFQLKDGRWAINIVDSVNGTKRIYGHNKTEVINKKKEYEKKVMTGEYVKKNQITIHLLASQMLENEFNQNHIKESTYQRHLDTLKALKPIANIPVQKINETTINAFFLKEIGKSQSSIRKEFELLKRTFTLAIQRKIISESPMRFMKMPKSTKSTRKIRALTINEQNKLLNVLMNEDINYSHQMLISLFTGMRMGEINALTKDDIFFDFNKIYIHQTTTRGKDYQYSVNQPKTENGERKIPINENVKAILKECVKYANGDLLFTMNNDGESIIATNIVNAQFCRVLEKYDILDKSIDGDVILHSLRHTYATRCIESGMNPKVLQVLLGHSDIRVTMNTYADAFDEFQAADIEKMNSYLESKGIAIMTKTNDILKVVNEND